MEVLVQSGEGRLPGGDKCESVSRLPCTSFKPISECQASCGC